MKQVYNFSTPESFSSKESEEFAKLLLDVPTSVRTQILPRFGLSIDVNAPSVRVRHNGRKVGVGSFQFRENKIHFRIAPKTEAIKLKILNEALQEKGALSSLAKFSSLSRGPMSEGDDDFTPIYLLGLLDEIVASSKFLLSTNYKKKQVVSRGGVKGRPLLMKTLIDFELGKGANVYCETLDNKSLREYALILFETANSIISILNDWSSIVDEKKMLDASKLKFLSSRFGLSNTVGFSPSLVFKVCRPPFPYGLKEVLYKCLRYWKWQYQFHLEEPGQAFFDYFHIIVELDRLFELYVGKVWKTVLGDLFEASSGTKFKYRVSKSDTFGIKSASAIILDHSFYNKNKKEMIVVDAKYRKDVATNTQIYQMLAYSSYLYPFESGIENIAGILVYPGSVFSYGEVSGFDKRIYYMQLPIVSPLPLDEVSDFVSKVLEF